MSEIIVERSEKSARIVLNRPDAMNTMSNALLDQLTIALEDLNDSGVDIITITGSGKAFCAGGDLTETHDRSHPNRAIDNLRYHTRAAELLREGPAITIAIVNGAAAGAGFALAAACDLRLVHEKAVFRSAFLTAGMSGDFGLSWSLTRLIGAARAAELLYLNEKVSAVRAYELGLATKVLSSEHFEAEVAAIVTTLEDAPPLALAGIKANLNDAHNLQFAEAMRHEAPRHIATGFSADAVEAGDAFLNKRRPVFSGK
ncbi:enoyl-CoA hydratase-related protein [Brevibacterium sp. 91QC2O2]|uniref:enoyl-CoA hydratase-related protein n=1 Tax=Brevibacterium TaxID=1696 RepID=UPI00211C4A11|nr:MULTISPECIES: enoyl-CoA hydratase-related protein [unclassified Brevibacterium]MCQ9369408.1 enoyl-CoA hydratase-related protein [Brevibacterium sp. 91QC2O2]MCQ9387016.1 enoyl-CoA hydratase-related protein [Brevibacterium sp. 68QC2CO]